MVVGNVEIPNWLEGLPLAPEFRPTDTEFADPIAYISKIEKEASTFGICKIVPPLPKPSKKYVFSNLNKSLLKRPELGPENSSLGCFNSSKTGSGGGGSDGLSRAVFTTRQQELGQNVKKTTKGSGPNPLSCVQKHVWQSGEVYTLEQFESKSKSFAKDMLGLVKDVSPLVIEAMFWKAASEKPIYIEYANDVPGSAFGESRGRFRFSQRSRRKRTYYKSRLDISDCKQTELESVRDTQSDEYENKDTSARSHVDTCLQTSQSATTVTLTSNEASQSTMEKSLDASDDMQGTAGWKLSNSPWNLQVIARSSGSLTRFMPDDIPGVTSPMVYIGMLFSWFAWHVEDHELHSLNFLHTGSAKTWYAVPGDYAVAFEEVIRSKAYGGNIDHLAALKLLGEKTTLLSPELVAASGIPCCRLIQNPGEFVVTFPRAYHVGFSHGFNCGEAANFGTPQWLIVAKEAAVRRAAMNHLPMLSHQQLLYLLTMSFISRVPRTLLPGVRSSRLRDRQKEEREFLVKKAFIEDVLQENKLLSILFGKDETKQAVLWNSDLLPGLASTTGNSLVDMPNIKPADKSSHCLLDEMSLYMENLADLYVDGDDLPSHFQTDSGALVCVGCGILGFPFMAVVQPSEKLMEIFPIIHHLVQDSTLNSTVHSSVSRDPSVSELSSAKELPDKSLKSNKCWNTTSEFLRPRIFCMEHAIKIVEILQCKGGANVLIICHSDYQKMKAHARAVAEEIHITFDYDEVPLDIASPENSTLIDMAIDGEERDECEDWTSKLGINLRYCVNARNKSSSKHIPLTLGLGMPFSDKGPGSELISTNWHSRRSRSKRLNHFARTKPPEIVQKTKDDQSEGRIDGSTAKEKVIQYSRRKFKSKQSCFSRASMVNEFQGKSENVSTVLCEDQYNCVSKKKLVTDNFRNDRALVRDPIAVSSVHHEIQVTEVPDSTSLNTDASQLSSSFLDHILVPNNSNAAETVSIAKPLTAITEKETDSSSEMDKVPVVSDDKPITEHTPTGEACEVSGEAYAAAGLHNNTVILDVVMQQETQVGKDSERELNQSSHVLADQCCEFTREECSDGLNEEAVSESVKLSKTQDKNTTDEEPGSTYVAKGENNSVVVSELGLSEISVETCPKEKELKIQPTDRNDEERDLGSETSLRDSSISTEECSNIEKDMCGDVNGNEANLSLDTTELESSEMTKPVPRSNARKKRKREVEQITENQFDFDNFIRSPCEGLRPRAGKIAASKSGGDASQNDEENQEEARREKRPSEVPVRRKNKKDNVKKPHRCDLDGCSMRFVTKAELQLHKLNLCPHEGCGKKFSNHKYALVHQRVHDDERPLKCPWKGCSVSFKWAWARTEHIRVHTGEKPYKCKVDGCGLSFRFVSDFSRHRRKTGHYVKSPA